MSEDAAKPEPTSVDWIKLFEGVDPGVLEGVMDEGKIRELKAGEILLAFGEENTFLYILLSGHAQSMTSL